MANLKFYLTSSEPGILNAAPSQSIGGYASATEYSVASLLTEPLDLLLTSVALADDVNTPYALGIDGEIVKVDETFDLPQEYGSSELLTVERGTAGTPPHFHAIGDSAYPINKDSIFNGSLNSQGKQYRCLAAKNTSQSIALHSLQFYIKKQSSNPNSNIQIAVEVPTVPVLYQTTTSGTSISVVTSGLIGAHPNNYFNGRLFVVSDPTSLNYNVSRIIASFDTITGTLTFKNSFPFSIEPGKSYRIEQPQSQTIITGRISPSFSLPNISLLSSAIGFENATAITIGGHGTDLLPNEVVYIWLARDVSSNTDKYVDNGFVFTAAFF